MAHHTAVNAKTILSAAASFAASVMLVKTIVNEFFPNQFIQSHLISKFNNIFRPFSARLTLVVEEFQGLQVNTLFEAAHVYLGAKGNSCANRMIVRKGEKDKAMSITIDRNQLVLDVFGKLQVKWKLVSMRPKPRNYHGRDRRKLKDATTSSEIRFYELTFHKKDRDLVLNSYLPYVMERSKILKQNGKAITIHTVSRRGRWNKEALRLDHPMSFENLAMDMELKKTLMEDLDNFLKRREYYRRIGRAWKRGYLLYGPPGTGKSSLIVAMAKFMNYDIFYMDLNDVERNADLKSLLMSMSNRSMLVIEDIDCNIADYNDNLTLSGVLNFIDGLWSCCVNERVVIFTTNYKEKLDPALLRPGRMDVHINMSYCSFTAFWQLAFNYLEIEEHRLFPRVKILLEEVEATPAEVAGELMKSTDAELALQSLVVFLDEKSIQNKTKRDSEVDVEDHNVSQASELCNLQKRSQRLSRGRRGRSLRVIL
ncbi:hypothetical protein QQ045_018431 [Rhodiola kirilowii]